MEKIQVLPIRCHFSSVSFLLAKVVKLFVLQETDIQYVSVIIVGNIRNLSTDI